MAKNTKEQVLELLKESVNQFRSGQEIAEKLFVTRASVWKAIRALQNDGYRIEAVTNKGYRLIRSLDSLDAAKIRSFLAEYASRKDASDSACADRSAPASSLLKDLSDHISVYEQVDSTNIVVSHMQDLPAAVAIADQQTAGRGRRGRSFHSPSGSGIYMSILLHPDDTTDLATGFTCMMAVAVCRAVRSVLRIRPEIKWVNDLFCNGKKVAGILTEGTVSVEDNTISGVIIGMGLNVYSPHDGFPKELRSVAGSLLTREAVDADIRNRLCAAILCEFCEICTGTDRHAFAEEYRSYSMLIGKYVRITDFSDHSYRYACVEDIDDDCHLCVRYENGTKEALSTGEVSVTRY